MKRRTPPRPEDTVDDVVRDARRWRALMSSERIRVATEIHQPHSKPVPGAKYLMLELWSHSDMPSTKQHHMLTDYVDFIIELEGMK